MHVSANYLRFVIAKAIADGTEVTVELLNEYLLGLGLPGLEVDEHALPVQVLSNRLIPPVSFQFYSTRHEATAEFMRDQKLAEMWHPSDAMREAKDIFKFSQLKEAIQLMLTGRVSPAEISSKLPLKFERTFSPAAIALFGHYFWNISLVSAHEFDTLLRQSPMRSHYLACYWGSRDQATWRAGFSPRIDGHRALKEAHRSLHMRIEATRRMPDDFVTARMLAGLTKELVAIHGVLFGEGAGVEEMAKDLSKQLRMKQLPENVIDIRSVARAGNYTGSGVKHGDDKDSDE